LFLITVWAYFGEKEISVKSSGLIQTESKQNIVSLVNGVVDEVNFSEGDLVEKGDLIFTLDVGQKEYDIKTYTHTLDGLLDNIALYQKFLDSIDQSKNLFNVDIYSELSYYYDYEKYLISLEDADNKIQYKNEKLSEYYSQISSTNDSVIQYQNEIAKLELEIDSYEFYAIETGYIHFTTDLQVGSVINTGNEVASISKKLANGEKYEILLYVSNSDITQLEIGQNVRVNFQSLSSKEYGFGSAIITSISADQIFDSNSNSSYYLVHAKLNETEYSNNSTTIKVRVGMMVEGRIITHTQKYLYYFIDKLELWVFD